MNRIKELRSHWEAIQNDLGASVKLVAVSKTYPVDDIRTLYHLGQRDFGENRVQELKLKSEELKDCPEIKWHFLGHIQTNKLKTLLQIPNVAYIHSIDSLKLINLLYTYQIYQNNRSIGFFVEVNTSEEKEKSGVQSREELYEILKIIRTKTDSHSNFQFIGLMTMGNIRGTDFEQDAKRCFSKLIKIREEIIQSFPELPKICLSMGMSLDYRIALQYGTDYVRIGSALFGPK